MRHLMELSGMNGKGGGIRGNVEATGVGAVEMGGGEEGAEGVGAGGVAGPGSEAAYLFALEINKSSLKLFIIFKVS